MFYESNLSYGSCNCDSLTASTNRGKTVSVVEDLIGQTAQIRETIGESLDTTRGVVEKLLETKEELGGALTRIEEAKTGTDGLLQAITDAKQTTAGILGDDAVAGFIAAEEHAGSLVLQLDGIRQ